MTAPSAPVITLRESTADDEPFLFRVYCSSRADEMAQVPWPEEQKQAFLRFQFAAQHSYYHEQFPHAAFEIINADDQPVGRLYTLRNQLIRILDITVLPEFRNRGIGSVLIDRIVRQSQETGKAIQLYVETFNPSIGFFSRYGFSKVAEDGLNYLLEYRPAGIREH
jgi:ribosomal protein S18 acetylase RimI-like enzyme